MIGIDVSENNYINDYTAIRKQIDFAIIRVGYGVSYTTSQRDKYLKNHYNGLKDKPHAFYYYGYANAKGEGVTEANNCMRHLKEALGITPSKDIILFYDVEDKTMANKSTVNVVAKEWIETVTKAGFRAGIYSYTSFISSTGLDMNLSDIDWIAVYGKNDGTNHGTSMHYELHQYTSKGKLNGCNGNLDLSYMSEETFNKLFKQVNKGGVVTVAKHYYDEAWAWAQSDEIKLISSSEPNEKPDKAWFVFLLYKFYKLIKG